MLNKLMKKVFGSRNERLVKRMLKSVERINVLEPAMSELSDEALAAKTVEFRERLANGETTDALLPEAFAVVREAGKRVLGMRHFDVQLAGGWAMLFFALFIASSTVLFGGVPWSKFAHMFFKPAAAYQKKITKADGSRENLPDDYTLTDPAVQARFPDIPEYMGDTPPYMGLGIKREAPHHY